MFIITGDHSKWDLRYTQTKISIFQFLLTINIRSYLLLSPVIVGTTVVVGLLHYSRRPDRKLSAELTELLVAQQLKTRRRRQ